jgi:hypothetical protein
MSTEAVTVILQSACPRHRYFDDFFSLVRFEEPEAMFEIEMKYNDSVSDVGSDSVTPEESTGNMPDELRKKLDRLGYLNI